MQSSQHMQSFVTRLLKQKLPAFYYYHNYAHTLYVTEKAIEIGKHEKCTAKEKDLLTAAALWHDTGFISTYAKHEEESCKLARQYLPGYGYSAEDINAVCGMIMATRLPQSPKNKLETIVADADLEYLGTSKAHETADKLFKEMQHLNPSLTKAQWNKTQVAFLQAHRYFTAFCKENREPQKQAYLQSLLNETE
jgi:uncharacterized protein